MKHLLFAALLVISLVGYGQQFQYEDLFKTGGKDTATRFIKFEGDSFCIVYAYGNSSFDTLVERIVTDSVGNYDAEATAKAYADNIHYNADVFVYKIKSGKRIKSYSVIAGIYVPAGCYEDIPEQYVKKALGQ